MTKLYLGTITQIDGNKAKLYVNDGDYETDWLLLPTSNSQGIAIYDDQTIGILALAYSQSNQIDGVIVALYCNQSSPYKNSPWPLIEVERLRIKGDVIVDGQIIANQVTAGPISLTSHTHIAPSGNTTGTLP